MEALRQVPFQDSGGRYYARLIPGSQPDSAAVIGVPVGPPPLDDLGLPAELTTRLHNELYNRGIFTARDAMSRRGEVAAALMAALKVDVGRVVDLYMGDMDNAEEEHPAEQPDARVHNRRPRRTR